MKVFRFVPLLAVLSGTAFAQVIPIDFNNGDVISYDGWSNFSMIAYPGYGSFPGGTAWPGPIGSNTPDSGDANLNKVDNGAGGGPFIGTSSLYFGGFSNVQNTLGGTVSVTDNSIISDLNTVVFQIQIGQALGYDLYDGAAPILMINGTTPVALQYTALINQFDTGETFLNPVSGDEEPIFLNTWGFQWDLSGISDPITSLSIEFSAVQHSQIYALQLDQSSGIYTSSLVPEPSTALLGGVGLGLAFVLRRRRAPVEKSHAS
jgi:hypothetical protein